MTTKRVRAIALAAILAIGGALTSVAAQSGDTLRIMSYNILNGKQIDGKTFNFAGQTAVIKRIAPDIATIDEVDSLTTRSQGHFVLREYAEKLGMLYFYSPAIDYQGGKYGIGALAHEQPIAVKHIALPGREEARTLLILEYPRFVFAATHFSLTAEDQYLSVLRVRREAATYNKPFFLAGDLNCTPESSAGKALARHFTLLTNPQEHTFPADAPTATIDYIALYKNDQAAEVELLRSGVANEPTASDHRPVFADVRFVAPSAINGVRTTAPAANNEEIFSIDGVRFFGNEASLPKGIYICGGRKILVR